MKEKRIYELSPIEKSWSHHIKRLAAILDFGQALLEKTFFPRFFLLSFFHT